MLKYIKVLFIFIFLLSIMTTSCIKKGFFMNTSITSNETIANQTFEKILNAVKKTNSEQLGELFSENTQNSASELKANAERFVCFIEGEIISFSKAEDKGVGVDSITDNGKEHKEIQSSFELKTTANTYLIAIKECINDTFDKQNVGLLSLYIIKADQWDDFYIFRGDGKWTLGIIIMDNSN